MGNTPLVHSLYTSCSAAKVLLLYRTAWRTAALAAIGKSLPHGPAAYFILKGLVLELFLILSFLILTQTIWLRRACHKHTWLKSELEPKSQSLLMLHDC